jgi:hypothetical protein
MSERICNYKPTQGQMAKDGKVCLLPYDHDGPHVYEEHQVPKASSEPISDQFTDEEIAKAISEEEIRARSQKLDEAQGLWERAYDRAVPKIPCPECNTRGAIIGGSLGDACPTCHGRRVIDDDSADVDFEMPMLEIEGKKVPLFPAYRSALSAYGDALALRKSGMPLALQAGDDQLTKRQRQARDEIKARMVLPDVKSLPSMEAIDELVREGIESHKALAAGGEPGLLRRAWNRVTGAGGKPMELPPAEPLPKTGFETEGGIEETASDKELDEMEREKGIQ